MDRDVDELVRRNVERQLAGFDWDRQRRTVMHRLEAGRAGKLRRIIAVRVAAGAAAVLVLVAGYVGISLLHGPDHNAAETTVSSEPTESDALLASTDPATILLTGPMRLLVSNDPTLAPHSVWDQ